MLLQENVQTLAQEEEGEQYCKTKKFVRASTDQGRMSIGLDYRDKDGIGLEVIEPAQKVPKKTYLRKL